MSKRQTADPGELLPLTPVVLHILLALAVEDGASRGEGRHGYAVAQDVEALTAGAIRMGPGTLYGSLQRMLAAKLIDEVNRVRAVRAPEGTRGEEDERRRYYRLTPLGRLVLELELQRLARVVGFARRKHLLGDPEPA